MIAIVELGGGWIPSDMAVYFASIHQPLPQIMDISVDGTKNTPGGDADGEVALDIQVAAAAYYAATGKTASIHVYWARDIAPAVRAARRDGCDVCSISWGADEADWGEAAAKDMEQAAIEATASGMVVLAASGGSGTPSSAHQEVHGRRALSRCARRAQGDRRARSSRHGGFREASSRRVAAVTRPTTSSTRRRSSSRRR